MAMAIASVFISRTPAPAGIGRNRSRSVPIV